VLPDVPPAPPEAPVAPAASVEPAALPVVPDPPDIEPPLELVLPVEGEAVVLGVVVVVVEAPGDVVSAVRRSQPATTAVSATTASMSVVSLDIDRIEISLRGLKGLLSHHPAWRGGRPGRRRLAAANRTAKCRPSNCFTENATHFPCQEWEMTRLPGAASFCLNRKQAWREYSKKRGKNYIQNKQALHSLASSLPGQVCPSGCCRQARKRIEQQAGVAPGQQLRVRQHLAKTPCARQAHGQAQHVAGDAVEFQALRAMAV
jgi:hypothetical protein